MARKLSGREYFLVGVLIVAAGAVLFWRDDRRLFGRSEEGRAAAMELGDSPQVNWDRLVADPEAYDPGGRNLFQYYTPPPRPVERPAAPPVPRPQAPQRPVASPTAAREASRPAAARPPTVSFRYLGFLGPKDDKIAVFEHGEELDLVRVGETFREDFRLVAFKYEGVVIGYVDERFKDQTTELRMSR